MLPLAAQLWLADTAAAVGWRSLPAMHQRVCENVARIVPAAEVERVARAQWRNYLRYLRDFVALLRADPEELERAYQQAEGMDHVRTALADGHGVILASAHFGNWDMAAGALARHYPVNVIADIFSSPRFDRLVTDYRNALRIAVLPIDKVLRRTLSALRRDEVVCFLVDKPLAGDEGVEVEFFGESTHVPAGAAFFAAKSGAPIVPGFMWRGPDHAFRARVLPPVYVPREADLQQAMQQLMRVIEDMIRANPEQWYMFRRMWPARPDVACVDRPLRVEEAVA